MQRMRLPVTADPRGDGHPSEPSRQVRHTSILVIDEFGLDHFDQLACTMRRRGVRAVLIRGSRSPPPKGVHRLTRWVHDHWMYDGLVRPSELGDDGSLPARLAGDCVLDVLSDENTLAGESSEYPAIFALAGRGLVYNRFPPEQLIDKFEVNAILQTAGVRVPPQVRARDISAEEAVVRFGLPLVIKSTTGAGGLGVRIAASPDEVESGLDELSGDRRDEVFYQKHIEGRTMTYGAVTGPEGPLLEHGFLTMSERWPRGPSAVVQVFDDPPLMAAGRMAVHALGCLGLTASDFIRDRNGDVWHLDANLRCWATMISLLGAGIDYPGAYLALLRHLPYDPQPRAAAANSSEVAVLPFKLLEAAMHGSRRELSAMMNAFLTLCCSGPGSLYGAIYLAKTARLVAHRALRRTLPATRRTTPPHRRANSAG